MIEEYHPNIDEYELIYGQLPNDSKQLSKYIQKMYKLDQASIKEAEEKIKSIQWNEQEMIFYIIPKGTPRPRSNGNHFYVKGASQLHRIFKKYLRSHGVICTRVEYELVCYLPTPLTSMTHMEVYLAEKGLIRPMITPDWDNLAKTYTDCLQETLLLNDNIINPGRVEKYFSIKPRINIKIRWQSTFDSNYNEKKVKSSRSFKKLFGGDDTGES